MKRGLSHHLYSGFVATLPLSRSSSSLPCSVYAAFMSHARAVNPEVVDVLFRTSNSVHDTESRQHAMRLRSGWHNTGLVQGAGAISVINHYYGRDDVPVGAFVGNLVGVAVGALVGGRVGT